MRDTVTNLPRCQGVKADGTPCERTVAKGKRYCYAHDSDRAEERRANASKAAKSKTSAEIAEVKAELRQLAKDVLSKKVTPGIGSVASQVLGTWLKCVDTEIRERDVRVRELEFSEIKLPEFKELQGRLEELEAAVEATQEKARQRGRGMATRDKLKRLQKLMRGNREAIPQRDGSTVYLDPEEAFVATFGYFTDSLRADADREPRPEPPEVLKAVAGAADRRAAYEKVMGEHNHIPVDPQVLVEEGRFEPRCMVAGYATYQEYMASEGVPDLSEK